MSLTATYDGVLSRIRIAQTALSTDGTTKADVQRSIDGLIWTTVRGSGLSVVSGNANLDDYEFPAGIATTYRVVQYVSTGSINNRNALTTNMASVETDTTGFLARANTNIARTTAQAAHGVASLSLTSVAAGTMGAETSKVALPIIGGSYTAVASFRSAVSARSCQVTIEWYNSADVSQGTSVGSSVADTTTGFTQVTVTGAVPATAVKAKVIVEVLATGAGSEVHYVDKISLHQGTSTTWVMAYTTVNITQDLTAVWFKSISRAFLNQSQKITGAGEITRPNRSGVFDVIGRSFPVVVSDVRGSKRISLQVNTITDAQRDNFDYLLASGDPVFIHVPSTNNKVQGGYYNIDDSPESLVGIPTDQRFFNLSLTEIAAPTADIVPVAMTWQGLANRYPTWNDVVAANATWNDVLALTGVPSDVIIP